MIPKERQIREEKPTWKQLLVVVSRKTRDQIGKQVLFSPSSRIRSMIARQVGR